MINILWDVVQWLVIGVGVNYILRKWVGDQLYTLMTKSDRRVTIWEHYIQRAKGEGNHAEEVQDCQSHKCAIL